MSSNISAVHRRAAMNHIELRCVGSSITAAINGTTVASAHDSTYQAGRMWIGASVDRDTLTFGIAMFDNLVVRGVPAPAQTGGRPVALSPLPANVASEAN